MKGRRQRLKPEQSGSVDQYRTDRIKQKADILPEKINRAEKN